MRSLALTSIVWLFFSTSLFGLQSTQVEDVNVQSFEMIWKTIRDAHWDKELVGSAWEKSRTDLLPKVKSAKDIREARAVMIELIGSLGQSHFGIIPSDSYAAIEDSEGGGSANCGITARLVGGQIVVTKVRAGSSADQAGVLPGWVVNHIRSKELTDLIDKLDGAITGPERLETIVGRAVESRLSSANNNRIPVAFTDNTGETRDLELSCDIPKGAKLAKLGHLPAITVVDETKTLDGNIGYYYFSAFLDPGRIMLGFNSAVRDKDHFGGLVIDLRGNPGGLAAMTMGMAGQFVSKQKNFGVMTTKENKLNFIAFPRPIPYDSPVAVLVDECSISSSEILAAGLQDLGVARVFGNRTAGLALPSVIVKLPNGDGFQYAVADYHSASGKSLEKDGVIPDETIELNREILAEQIDPVLEAALKWIKKNGKG